MWLNSFMQYYVCKITYNVECSCILLIITAAWYFIVNTFPFIYEFPVDLFPIVPKFSWLQIMLLLAFMHEFGGTHTCTLLGKGMDFLDHKFYIYMYSLLVTAKQFPQFTELHKTTLDSQSRILEFSFLNILHCS